MTQPVPKQPNRPSEASERWTIAGDSRTNRGASVQPSGAPAVEVVVTVPLNWMPWGAA